MSKTKMRCNTCGKWFQSANAKDLTCPDCTQKARKEKLAAKQPPTTQPTGQANTPARPVPPPPKPKPATGGTSHWLDAQNDVKVGQPDQPARPKIPSSPAPRDNRGGQERGGNQYSPSGSSGPSGPGNYREGGYRGPGGFREGDTRGPGNFRENNYRTPTPYRVGGGMGLPDTAEQRPRQPMTGNRPPRPGGPGEERTDKFRPGGKPGMSRGKKPSKPKSAAPPKPKKEKIPPPEPFKPTDEQIAQVENRYLELAVPTEFDGIRTQIAHEMSIPKAAVKKIIKDLRDRQNIPSWWEIQSYKGSSEELEKIKELYEPHLPLPTVGVHKQIAEQLSLKPGDVYQAIKAIRLEMNLPQFNDPALHGIELKPRKKAQEPEQAVATESLPEEQKEETAQTVPAELSAEEKQQPADVSTEPLAEEKSQPADVPAELLAEEKQQPAEPLVEEKQQEPEGEEKKQEPEGEFSSIETDVKFQQVGDTTAVVAATTHDNTPAES
ncbi:MAG: hypothetical protein ABI465_09035 [Ktedonobacteraceae bacterium]